ncbi:MAG: response regulator transcription factor [Chloroflexi bacterium]|nr:response regulator transcription factor [Chloroflexota bacterium]MDA1217857.1 response regulator transcription factor [Chloroflexota bacterium]
MTEQKALRVLIVENHDIVRACLCMLMSRRRDIETVGEASTAAEAIAKVAELKPDIVVIDTNLPDRSGIEASREIRARFPDIRVLLLTAHGDDRAILGSVLAGASGYLLREICCAETLDTIRKVSEGASLLDPTVTRRVLARVSAASEEQAERRLTEAEKRILELVVQGRNDPEIAGEESLSESTVKEHIMTIHGKLEITRRSQSVTWRTRRELGQSLSPANPKS